MLLSVLVISRTENLLNQLLKSFSKADAFINALKMKIITLKLFREINTIF